jgi:hypothetical protein
MKKRIRIKKILFLSLILSIAASAAAIIGWQLLSVSFVKSKLSQTIKALPSDVEFNSKNIKIEKSFPYLIIKTKSLSIKTKDFSLSAQQIYNKFSVTNYISAILSNKNYYGSMRIKKINIKIKEKTQQNSINNLNKINIIPFNLNAENISIDYKNHKINGKLLLKYIPILNRYKTDFSGIIDNIHTKIDGYISNQTIDISFFAKLKKISQIDIDNIKGSIKINNFNNISIDAKSGYAAYRGLKIDNIHIESSLAIHKKEIEIKKMELASSNGYKLKLSGFFNKYSPMDSTVKGEISTPFINAKPFIKQFAEKNIQEYIFDGYVSLNKVNFFGRPSLEFIKKGKIYLKNVLFRLDKKSSNFLIKNGTAIINENRIDVSASGNFEDIKFNGSNITIHRTKGYPCDMDLKYRGNANDLARIFLEENIFSKSDLKVLGKSKKLKGNFSATTKIHGYRWAGEPYFNFDINIHSNGVEIINENMPSKFAKSWGDVQIKRLVEFGNVKSLFIRFRNLKLEGLSSKFYTKDATLYIMPKIRFLGSFNSNLSKDDFNYLEKAIIGKEFIKSRVNVELVGSINGNIDDFKFQGKALSNTPILSENPTNMLYITTQGHFTKGILSINKLQINKKLNIHGAADMKRFSFNITAYAKDFHIHSLSNVIESQYLVLKDGIINGKILMVGDEKNALGDISGNIYLKKGYYSKDINNITSNIIFNNKNLIAKNASLNALGNKVNFRGNYSFEKDRKVELNLHSKQFILNINKLKNNLNKINSAFKIPKQDMNITFTSGSLSLILDNITKKTDNFTAKFYNKDTESALTIHSEDTNIGIFKSQNELALTAKDYIIMPLLSGYKKTDNLLTMNARLKTPKKDTIDLKNLQGDINMISRNGEFKDISNALKFLSATNVIEVIIGKTRLKKDLPYNRIIANLEIKNGIIKTQNNKVTALYGKNLNIFAEGSYDIVNSYIDAYITFTTFRAINTLISHIPIMGWIVGGKEKSFSGISFRIKGYTDKKINVIIAPIESLGKGFLNMIKRTITLPFNAFGVAK